MVLLMISVLKLAQAVQMALYGQRLIPERINTHLNDPGLSHLPIATVHISLSKEKVGGRAMLAHQPGRQI